MFKNQRIALLTLVALVAMLVLAACGGGSSTPTPIEQTLGMTDTFKFEPATVIAEPGAQVTLHLKNNGAPHDGSAPCHITPREDLPRRSCPAAHAPDRSSPSDPLTG